MKLTRTLSALFLLNLAALGYCANVLAWSGYLASNPQVRRFLITSGLSSVVTRKAEKLYEVSNFRSNFDQGTDIRRAEMDTHSIIEISPDQLSNGIPEAIEKRTGQGVHENDTGDEDRMYSEKLFSVLTEMDKKNCAFRLLCEIGANPDSFGIMGYKINHYVKSVPPVTWNSATFSYLEAFQSGLGKNKVICNEYYPACQYNLNKVMKFLFRSRKL